MKSSKKTICISMIFIIAIVSVAAGCSSKNTATVAADGTQVSTGQQSGSSRSGRGGSRSSESSLGTSTENAQGSTAGGASSSGQTQILGKVTSIIGNEVVLSIGTQASEKTSSALTLTGENKTLLIPVGLSLSGGTSGTGSGSFGAAGASGGMPAGTGETGGMPNGTGTTSTRTSGSRATGTTGTTGVTGQSTTAKATTGTAAGTSTIKRTSDFSSITAGMVLRITQQTIDGTESVVRVAIVSK